MTLVLSPYAQTLGIDAERDSQGRLVLLMAFGVEKLGRPGFLHGGAIAGFLETAAYMTLAEALGDADQPQLKPVNVTVTFLRGGRDHITRACATISRLGRRMANVDIVAWQEDETKPIATAQMNVLLDRTIQSASVFDKPAQA
jgi:uncharacterized protein (TIGR00369 family)